MSLKTCAFRIEEGRVRLPEGTELPEGVSGLMVFSVEAGPADQSRPDNELHDWVKTLAEGSRPPRVFSPRLVGPAPDWLVPPVVLGDEEADS